MNMTISSKSITTEAAMKLAQMAIEEGKAIGVNISLSIVNPQMQEMIFVRQDGATAHSRETSKKKALTAASTKRETGWMSNGLEVTLPMATGILTNILGGMPIFIEGEMVGAFGIAGGTVEQDALIANKAMEKMGLQKVAK